MKIKSVSVLASLLLVLSMTLAGATAFADKGPVPNGRLASQIDYWFVGHLGQMDYEGRLLVWDGIIQGSFTGEVKWWFVIPGPVARTAFDAGEVAFYAARWEIRVAGELALAGESAGKTVFPTLADGIWDGHGVVTEAKGSFSPLKGRKMYETGTVLLGSTPPVTFTGTGMFSVY